MIVDWYPIELLFSVSDNNGVDLLDSTKTDFVKGVTLKYKDKTYPVSNSLYNNLFKDLASARTKYYMPSMCGLQLLPWKAVKTAYYLKAKEKYYLYFGELDGAESRDDTFTINWGDGTIDVIRFTRKISGLNAEDKWYLNDKEVTGRIFDFVK
ncbi:MAG: hypothetical protein IJG54_01120 [Bacteroidales bacterium]|nr:hypothetical protein [Bacteroidales bacterium]